MSFKHKCKKCGGKMKRGIAIQSTLRSVGDFHESDFCTYSVGGPGRIIPVLKCERCGRSVSK